ncbi:hypothetical protein, partial [Azorhizobium caulinodans]
MDDWAESVRKAIETDPEQPDRALLLYMLDQAMELAESESSVARTRQQIAELRAATAELVAAREMGARIREATQRVAPLVERIKTQSALLRAMKTQRVPSGDFEEFRRQMAEDMATLRSLVRNAHQERWSAERLSELLPVYLEAKAKTLRNSKHLSTLGPRIGLFIQTVGDKPVRDYERADLETFRDLLDQTPSRWEARFRTKVISEAIA